MFVEILLAAWSCAGLAWWIISWRLVAAAGKSAPSAALPREKKSLTVFKPLPPLGIRGLKTEAQGLESFIAQLDETSELVLGVHETDWPAVEPFVRRMEVVYSGARVVVVRRAEADTLANPKIAWQKVLIPHAAGLLWLWSDADIVAPAGFLDRARAEFEVCGAEMLTFPYTVRNVPRPAALLDALFVNAEFYPGVLLLRRFGPVDFGLGAAMLFSRESFLHKVRWEELGASLSDDFMLGQTLQPVRLGSTTLETVADAEDWPAALAHYLRWKKTVCWCRPIGFAAQILIMPLLGWIGFVAAHPADPWTWVGFIAMIQADVLFAVLICREIGCSLRIRSWPALEIWSLERILFWLLSWLPLPVLWRGKLWRRFQKSPQGHCATRF